MNPSDETSQSILGEKEKVQILLAEYNLDRTEMIHRANSAYQILGFGAAAIAFLVSQADDSGFTLLYLLLGGPLAFAAIVCVMDVDRASARSIELEHEINRRAGERLLNWEAQQRGAFGRFVALLTARRRHPPST